MNSYGTTEQINADTLVLEERILNNFLKLYPDYEDKYGTNTIKILVRGIAFIHIDEYYSKNIACKAVHLVLNRLGIE